MTVATPASLASVPMLPVTYPEFLAALLAGDRRRCAVLTRQTMADGIPVIDVYQRLFQRALYRVGDLWEHNQISVASEHLATSIVEGLLNQIYPEVISPRRA